MIARLQQARGLVPVGNAQLASGPVAIGVHRSLGHAELPGDLLGTEMLVDKPQAFALPRRQQLNRIGSGRRGFTHSENSKRRLGAFVHFDRALVFAFSGARLTTR